MLILARQPGESLMIGDNITVTILEINGNQVKIGIDAPKNVDVHREEIYERIQRGTTPQLTGVSGTDMRTGSIADVIHSKGYGFIYSPGVDDNIFFHATGVEGNLFSDLYEGMDVCFSVERGTRGLIATGVRKA